MSTPLAARAKRLLRPPLTKGLERAARSTGATFWDYLRRFQWAGDIDGTRLLASVWRAGVIARLGLVLVVAGTLGTAYLVSNAANAGNGVGTAETALPPPIAVAAGLVLLTAAWSFGLAAASTLPLPVYLVASAYLAFFGIVIGGALAGTPAFALPTLWMLLVGWLVFCRSSARDRWLWLLVLLFGAGYLTGGALGMRRLMPDVPLLARSTIVATGYAALLCNPVALRAGRSAALQRLLQPTWAFSITSLVVAGFFYLAAIADPQEIAENTLLSLDNALGLIDFVWMWLGAGLFVGSLAFGRWCAEAAVRELPRGVARTLIPTAWIAFAVLCYAATRILPLPLLTVAHDVGLLDWVSEWSQPRYFTAYRHVYVAALVLAAALALRVTGRLTDRRLSTLNAVWVAGLVGVLGYYRGIESFVGLNSGAVDPIGLWPACVLIGGLLWNVARSHARWVAVAQHRVLTLLAVALAVLAISVVTLSTGSPQLVVRHTLYSFLGMLYLGLPMAAYAALSLQSRYQPVPGARLAALFAIGCASAIVVLGIDAGAGPHLLVVPLLWSIALLVCGQRLARLEHPSDGVVAGCALALGFTSFWLQPQQLLVPFLLPFHEWQGRYLYETADRSMFAPGQWWMIAGSLAVGAVLGAAFAAPSTSGLRSRTSRTVTAVAATALATAAFAFGIPRLPGLP